MEQKKCPVCGYRMREGDTYCYACARRERINSMKKCPVCGYRMREGDTYCYACARRERINSMKKCPVCGYRMREEDTYCRACAWRAKMDSMKRCPECGWLIREGETYCRACARRAKMNTSRTCPVCGYLIPKGSASCPICEDKNRRELSGNRIGIVKLSTTIENNEAYEETVDESAEIDTENVLEVCTTPDENSSENNEMGGETIVSLESSTNSDNDLVVESAALKSDIIEDTIEVEENVEVEECKTNEIIDIEEDELVEYQEGQRTELITDQGNTFFFELSNDWKLQDGKQFLSAEQKEKAYRFLTDINEMQRVAPSLYGIISNMQKKENVLIAELDKFTEQLVKEGKLWFSVDKNGELLPTVRNSRHIVKQVRLKEWTKPSVGNSQMVSDIYSQLVLTNILHEVQSLRSVVDSIRVEQHGDRLAQADSAISLYRQAIASSTLRREELLKEAGMAATNAKSVLIRELEPKLRYINAHTGKEFVDRILDKEGDSRLTDDANYVMDDLVGILQMVDIECSVHRYFGEESAIQECLKQYLDFVDRNKLDKRDTLLKVTECLPRKVTGAIDRYCSMTSNIFVYSKHKEYIEQKKFSQYLLTDLQKPTAIKTCKKCGCELANDNEIGLCEYCARDQSKGIKTVGKAIAGVGSLVGTVVLIKR